MMRSAATTLAKRAMQRAGSSASRNGKPLPPAAFRVSPQYFHSTPRKEETAKEAAVEFAIKDTDSAPVKEKEESGFSPVYAIPIAGILSAPLLELQLILLNEEFLVAFGTITFVTVFYTKAAGTIKKAMDDEAAAVLKVQNDAEDIAIKDLEDQLELLNSTVNLEEDTHAIMELTKSSVQKMSAAKKIKPQHDLKAQVEKMLNMISNEERNVYEKAKQAMMEEATASVMDSFLTKKNLKKSALNSSLAKLTGQQTGDPVQEAYMEFFKSKKAAAENVDAAKEQLDIRSAILTKMNGIAETDNMMFRFDSSGKPVMV